LRVLSQLAVEKAIMKENSKRFILAYSSPLLSRNLVEQFRFRDKKNTSKRLIEEDLVTESVDENLSSFLKPLWNPQPSPIYIEILVDQYINY